MSMIHDALSGYISGRFIRWRYRHRFHSRPFVTTTFDMFIAPAIILLSMPVEIEEAEFHNKFLQEIRATE